MNNESHGSVAENRSKEIADKMKEKGVYVTDWSKNGVARVYLNNFVHFLTKDNTKTSFYSSVNEKTQEKETVKVPLLDDEKKPIYNVYLDVWNKQPEPEQVKNYGILANATINAQRVDKKEMSEKEKNSVIAFTIEPLEDRGFLGARGYENSKQRAKQRAEYMNAAAEQRAKSFYEERAKSKEAAFTEPLKSASSSTNSDTKNEQEHIQTM